MSKYKRADDGGPIVPRWIVIAMAVTDIGFVAYWVGAAFGLLGYPGESVLTAWNWSFFGLDILASASGLSFFWLARRRLRAAPFLLTISLTLTHVAGAMALSFWLLLGEFDLAWWLPNLWLALFPLVAAGSVLRVAASKGARARVGWCARHAVGDCS